MEVKFENETEWQKQTSSRDEIFPANSGIIPVKTF
jgi:hypothetical protein